MRNPSQTRLTLVVLLIILIAGCRRGTQEPTPTVKPTEPATTEAPAQPSSTPVAAAPPATPAAEAEPDEDLLQMDPDAIDWAPELLYRSPAPGEETPLDGAITIRFDQPMAQETVEEAFTIRPADSVGDEEVEGAFEWPRPDTLIFTPRARLERQARYRVQIGESAAARNGRTLTGPLELYFDTAGFLEVARIIPEDGVGGVSPQVSVTVLFNRPVVPLVTTGQQADLPQPLEFDPPVEGSGEWLSTSIYTFIPEEGFAGATEYQVTVPAGLTDVVGGVLAEDVTSTFTTATPSVANIVLEPSATEVRPDRPITVTFNMAMDPASTESAISLDPQAPVTFEWSEENRVLSLVPEDLLALDTRYTLLIDDTARSANRAAMLDRETSTRFTTVPFPAVVSTDPGPGETAPFYQHGINIRFASPMDPATIRDRIQISPQPEEEVHYFIFEANVNLAFPLERDTDYTITIPGDVADPYGNTLGEAYTWQFRTPPPPPVASINLPAPVGQFSTVHPTTVGIIARNVETVNAALYRVGLQPRLLIEPYQLDDAPALANAEQIASWQLTPDLQGNEAEVVSLDLAGAGQTLPLGIYNLRVSGPGIGDDVRWWQNQNSLIVVADTNLVVKQTFEAVHVWATDLATGEPVADLPLTLYNRNGIASGTATTDASGLATFPYSPEEAYLSAVLVVAREPGQPGFGAASSQWNEGISPWQFGVDNTSAPPQPQFAYIYTDRPIYRPGDTVYFRGILRDANYARYGLPQEGEVTVEMEFTSYYEPADSESVALTLPVDANGTFNGAYQIPEGAQLGQYRLHLQDEQNIADAFRHFTVAEYRRPEFQVSVTPEQDEALRGETVDVIIEADYFFGAPAADLSVHWIIRERNYQLPWDGPFYSFDDDDNFYFAYGHDANFFGNFLREGTATTDADGRVVLTLPADLLAEVEDGSRVVTVEATVRDVSEFPISGTGEVVLHAAESYVGIAPEEYLNQAGTETTVNLITVNADAEPLPSQEVEVVFYERDYRFVEQTNPNGTSFGEWVADDTEVARTTATTGSNGRAEATFVPEAGGTYRAAATVTDANGRTHTSSVLFWVAGRDFVGWRVNPEEKRMDLTLDQRTYEVGDRARILVQSPFVGPVNAWLTIERGEVIEQRLITLQTNSDVVEIPVTEALSPNAYVTIVAMKGVDETNPFADLRVGLTELVVPPTPFTLDVELVPRDEFLSPGETVTYDIRVTDSNGQPVQADLSLALVDLAVLTLAPDNAPDIVDAFYAREAYRSTLGSGLIFSGEGLEAAIPEQDAGLGGGGGAEAVAMDAGRALAEEDSS
ncbi:MAG: Ig-like domain-containing protein, partial [Candidatus Promineifilaceae bacterium]|nr:Ig-like domain-containing protein [Candidatus Promineifilaceae bacterium]